MAPKIEFPTESPSVARNGNQFINMKEYRAQQGNLLKENNTVNLLPSPTTFHFTNQNHQNFPFDPSNQSSYIPQVQHSPISHQLHHQRLPGPNSHPYSTSHPVPQFNSLIDNTHSNSHPPNHQFIHHPSTPGHHPEYWTSTPLEDLGQRVQPPTNMFYTQQMYNSPHG